MLYYSVMKQAGHLVRKRLGLTQSQAAEKLGVSQAYVSMLERGKRSLPSVLARRLVRLRGLPPTALPVAKDLGRPSAAKPAELAKELAALGYPGFSYLRSRKVRNPAEVLLTALAQKDLESRLAEALPWVVLRYPNLDWEWLTRAAKVNDLQNRLGFVTTLARRLAEAQPSEHPSLQLLAEKEAELERSRLESEDTFCKESLTPAERSWLQQHRSEDAACWHLLTDLSPRHFSHVAVDA